MKKRSVMIQGKKMEIVHDLEKVNFTSKGHYQKKIKKNTIGIAVKHSIPQISHPFRWNLNALIQIIFLVKKWLSAVTRVRKDSLQ